MSDDAANPQHLNCPNCCAFVQLFKAWKIALRFSSLLLAFSGILGTYLTGRILDGMWAKESTPVVSAVGDQSELEFFIHGGGCAGTKAWINEQAKNKSTARVGLFRLLMRHARASVNETADAVVSLSPARALGGIAAGLMGLVWVMVIHPGYGILFFLITSLIWAIFGGATARVAAMHATRDERIGAGEALKFSKSKLGSFFFAPLMPAGAIIAGLLVMGLVALIFSWIPALGEILVGLLLVLAMLGGLVVAFLIIGGIVGYPLTYPTIAVEGSDAFDAFSRTFSYIYQRPWRTALYAIASLAYGAVCFLFAKFFVRLALWSAHVGIGLTMNWFSPYTAESAPNAVGKLDAIWKAPSLTGETPFYGSFDSTVQLTGGSLFAQFLFKAWIYTAWGLVAALFVSLFYASSTLIYLLLRKEVDATDLEEVFVEDMVSDEVAAPQPAPAAPQQPNSGTSLPIIGQGN